MNPLFARKRAFKDLTKGLLSGSNLPFPNLVDEHTASRRVTADEEYAPNGIIQVTLLEGSNYRSWSIPFSITNVQLLLGRCPRPPNGNGSEFIVEFIERCFRKAIVQRADVCYIYRGPVERNFRVKGCSSIDQSLKLGSASTIAASSEVQIYVQVGFLLTRS
ncbi:hypothetical protein TNCV_1774931 [Trichonephila clavipes]|nr:hypothetical protein TNCV_1774931 [Trichonephila clavipes]